MSEIYSPGAIAGPEGPSGPAGSQGSVTALASSLLPLPSGNLYDVSKLTAATSVNAADGSLTIGGQATDASGLIYCPGATSMVSNLPVNPGLWGGGICLYDANGNFISALTSSSYTVQGNGVIAPGVAFTLPGSQVYVRFGSVTSWTTWDGWAYPAQGMVYAMKTGTAALPSTYQPFGLETVVDVNAKIASTTANIGTALELFAQTVLPAPYGPNRNAFDPQKVMANTSVSVTGVLTSNPGYTTAMVFAPGATQFITNLPIRGSVNNIGFCLFDSFGNFLQEISASTLASDFPNDSLLSSNTVLPLPGTQTFIMFTFNAGNFGWGSAAGGYWCSGLSTAIFLAGTAANPVAASLPAGAPAFGSAGVVTRKASELGCPLDSNLLTGGGTDVTSLLNAFLATASAANPIKLILDGPCLVDGLILSPAGYTTIEGIGWGSGIVNKGAAKAISINSQPAGTTGTPPARTATNIALRNFAVGVATNYSAQVGILLPNCTNVLVQGVNSLGGYVADDFAIEMSNASQLFFSGCAFTSTGTGHDGIHIDGNCSDITISDCYFATGDDAIALNAPEAYGGNINRVTVTNCRFNGSLTVMRIYTSIAPGNIHTVSNVVVSNCTGTVTGYCFDLGITNGLSCTLDVDQLQDLSISNCTLSGPSCFAWIGQPCGSLTFRGIKFTPTSTNPVVQSWYPIGELTLDDFTILRNGNGNAAAGLLQAIAGNNATLDRVSLLNCRVVDQEGSSFTAVPYLVDCGGAINVLRLEEVDMTHIAAPFSSAGTGNIATLRGAGVLGTGTAVPDAVMDNNVLYLSSNAGGALSMKVAGTAKRITLA